MGSIESHVTALTMIHAYPTHVSAGYRIVEGMLMVRANAGRAAKEEDDGAEADAAPGVADDAP